MQSEKLAAIVLVVVIVLAMSVFLIVTYGGDLFQEKKTTSNAVEKGDCVDVNYTGAFLNGTVFYSNIESVARAWGLYNDTITYQPAKVFVDPTFQLSPPKGYENYSQSYVPGFLNGLIGMTQGETKNVTISPEDGYGTWNESLAQEYGVGSYPLETVVDDNVTENVTEFSSYFENVSLTVGTTFDYGAVALQEPGCLNATITSIDSDNVTYLLLPVNGTKVLLPMFNWNVTFIVENDTAFTMLSDIEAGHLFSIDSGYGFMHFKVISVNDTDATLAMNIDAPSIDLVDQTLVFQLEVVNLYKIA